jgi:tetratricopeptide (TPR) repeat protein
MPNEVVNKLWVRLVINFIGNWSGSTYILKHPDDAIEKFTKCEIYLKKIIDFGILSNMLIEFSDAKREVLEVTKKYKELKKVTLDFLKMVKESIGVNNIDYAYACYDVGYAYGLLNEGELSVKYRLMCIDTLHKLEQSDRVIKALSTHYGNLSGIYRNHLKDYKNAIICAQKCLDIKEKNNFEKNKSYGISLYKLGMSYGMNKEFKKSADLMQKALPYFKESSSKEIYQKSVLEVDLGIITNEFDKKTAEILLKKSIKIIESADICIYISPEVKKRIEIGKNILKSND